MTETKIPIGPDIAPDDAAGLPKPLSGEGDITIVTPPGNPDETVNVGKDMVDVDGVEEGNELEEQLNPTINQGENHD